MSEEKKTKKKQTSSVRHTRAIQRDRSKRPMIDAPAEQVAHFHQQGLRERTLTLPVMMAFVLSLIWRQIGSVSDLVRVVKTEAVLWAGPVRVSQQALSQRLSSLPAELFGQVLQTVLPELDRRWGMRQRPLAPELAWAQERYERVVCADGSTLDALIRKMGLIKEAYIQIKFVFSQALGGWFSI